MYLRRIYCLYFAGTRHFHFLNTTVSPMLAVNFLCAFRTFVRVGVHASSNGPFAVQTIRPLGI